MDLIRIDPDAWEPDAGPIENRTSLIWTERYQDPGEFVLTTNAIDYTRNLIPEDSFVGLRDSQEVMRVESHSIGPGDEGPVLTVKGRTFESFFEKRTTVVVNSTPGASAMTTYGADDIWPTDAALALIISHVTVSSDAPAQKVPGTQAANLITNHSGEQLSYKHKIAPLNDEVLNLLKMESAGIRNQLDRNGHLMIYIYKGVARTILQSSRPAVVFRLDAEYLDSPKYLWDKQNFYNMAYVVGDNWQQRVYAPGVSTGITGLNRRILYVDGSEIDSASSTTKKTKQATALGLAELAKHNKIVYFDAEISAQSPYVRGVDYNLGDRVTLMAKYGVSQTMLINEFVRTEDKEGERSYPTLVTPDEVSDDA